MYEEKTKELIKSFDIFKNSANQKCSEIKNFINDLENVINSPKIPVEEKIDFILSRDYDMAIWSEHQEFVRNYFKSVFDFANVVDNDYLIILEYNNWRFLFNKNSKIIKIYHASIDRYYIDTTPEIIEEQYKQRYDYAKDRAAVDYYNKKISLNKFLKIKYDDQRIPVLRYMYWIQNKKRVNKDFFEKSINETLVKIEKEKEACKLAQQNFLNSLNDLNFAWRKIKEILPNYTYIIEEKNTTIMDHIKIIFKEEV